MVKFHGNQLLIATRNSHKVQEISPLFQEISHIQLSTAFELDIPDPEETGQTFKENVLIKARAYAQAAGIPVLADDSGLCIKALDGFPGVHTARFAQESGGYLQAAHLLEEKLKDKSKHAYFCSCVALMLPTGEHHTVEKHIFGTLSFPPQGDISWGFNPIFIPDGYNQTYAEMPLIQKTAIDHRASAVRQIIAECF